jgi:hypothetical protein
MAKFRRIGQCGLQECTMHMQPRACKEVWVAQALACQGLPALTTVQGVGPLLVGVHLLRVKHVIQHSTVQLSTGQDRVVS